MLRLARGWIEAGRRVTLVIGVPEGPLAAELPDGVEVIALCMEAMTGASVGALTVYDMCKAIDRGMRVEGVHLALKEGGKSGRWEAPR